MIITPDNEAYLLKAPLAIDELQQIDFVNATAQANYFQSLPKLALMKVTYIRENESIVAPFNIEQIRSYNYVMYKNKNYGDKWFYAFITGMTYEGNTVTTVGIKTDVFQTYMFDYTWQQSYVKRETVADDTFGKHILPEGLAYGDYVLNSTYTDSEVLVSNASSYQTKTPLMIVQCSERAGVAYQWDGTTEGNEIEDMYIIGGVPQGCWYYIFRCDEVGFSNIREFKKYWDAIGKGSAIINVFLSPQQCVTLQRCRVHLYDKNGNVTSNYMPCYVASGNTYLPIQLFNKTLTVPTKIGTFTPKNNKTLCYPYNYILVTNNSGVAMDFHYEDFNGAPNFRCIGTLSVSTPFCLMPNNSKKSQNIEYGINTEMVMGTSLPCLSWDSDYYLNWIAQNGSQIRLDAEQYTRGELMNMIGGMASSAVNAEVASPLASAVASGVGGLVHMGIGTHDYIQQVEEKIASAKAVPNTVNGNLGAGDLAFSIYGSVGYKFYNYQIREDIARKIDAYFSMYGYLVDDIKIPNTKTRSKWNFIQTVGANITGDIPQEAIMELKNIYNTGVTIWHDPTHFLDYTQINSIV